MLNLVYITDLLTIMSEAELSDGVAPRSSGGKKKSSKTSSSSSGNADLMNRILDKLDNVTTELASMKRTAAATNASIAATNASVAEVKDEMSNVKVSIKESVENALTDADFANRLNTVEGRLSDDYQRWEV